MSGPKVTVYRLTPEQRALIAEQARYERDCQVARDQIQRVLREFRDFLATADRREGNVRLLATGSEGSSRQLAELEVLRSEVERGVARISRSLAGRSISLQQLKGLKRSADELRAKVHRAMREDEARAAAIRTGIADDLGTFESIGMRRGTGPQRLLGDDARDIARIRRDIANDLTERGVFGDVGVDEAVGLRAKRSELGRALAGLLDNPSLSTSLAGDVRRAMATLKSIDDISYLESFNTITVGGLVTRVEEEGHEQERMKARHDESLERYQSLCALVGEAPHPMPWPTTSPAAIDAEIERLERLLIEQRERAYVDESVDEVLESMGYDLIGSREVRKRDGAAFRSELFSFDEGTAVNVTYASDGRITLELGGLASEDRLPTADESELLTREMERFCQEFAEFERRMAAKGILVGKRIALAPPTADYTTIINTRDYAIDEDVVPADLSVRQSRHGGRKTMRMDDL